MTSADQTCCRWLVPWSGSYDSRSTDSLYGRLRLRLRSSLRRRRLLCYRAYICPSRCTGDLLPPPWCQPPVTEDTAVTSAAFFGPTETRNCPAYLHRSPIGLSVSHTHFPRRHQKGPGPVRRRRGGEIRAALHTYNVLPSIPRTDPTPLVIESYNSL